MILDRVELQKRIHLADLDQSVEDTWLYQICWNFWNYHLGCCCIDFRLVVNAE